MSKRKNIFNGIIIGVMLFITGLNIHTQNFETSLFGAKVGLILFGVLVLLFSIYQLIRYLKIKNN